MKRELVKGQRVRVYGWVNMHHSPYKPRGGGPAMVTYVEDNGFCHVRFDDEKGVDYSAHPKQLRRLLHRKKPCPPQEGEGKRRVWWLAIKVNSGMLSGCEQVIDGSTKGPPPMMLPPCSNQDMPRWTRVIEIGSNEVILDKAKMAKAWDEAINSFGPGKLSGPVLPSHRSCIFPDLAKRLGLEAK